jgi:hypothetical protein
VNAEGFGEAEDVVEAALFNERRVLAVAALEGLCASHQIGCITADRSGDPAQDLEGWVASASLERGVVRAVDSG